MSLFSYPRLGICKDNPKTGHFSRPGRVANVIFWLHVIEGMLFAFGHYWYRITIDIPEFFAFAALTPVRRYPPT
jgi:hypothetical protein